MNLVSIFLLLLVVVAVWLAVRSLQHRHGHPCSGCAGGAQCSRCCSRSCVVLFLLAATVVQAQPRTYYVSPSGRDTNAGTLDAPLATLARAHQLMAGGDTVYFRGGTYLMTDADIQVMGPQYAYVCHLDKAGSAQGRTCYMGMPGERPVFDFSAVVASGHRISAFALMADYIHLRNFEIVGVPVRILGHTQSECVSGRGGSHCIVENLAMHHGMAIGYYQIKGSDNLVLNCDAYCNYDDYSEGSYGGNVDGFGFHLVSPEYTGNRIRGCRAWRNSDDGYDLINCHSAVTIEDCYAFYNGFRPAADPHDTLTLINAGDGNGFKSGGFGMKAPGQKPWPLVVPVHTISRCIAFRNKAFGFYSNHHAGGNVWIENTAMANRANFSMCNRKSEQEVVDVPGYGHTLVRNVSYAPGNDGHLAMFDETRSTVVDNSFAPVSRQVTASMFVSTDPSTLFAPRLADGSLPYIPFLQPRQPIVGQQARKAILNVIGDSYVANHRHPKEESWHYRMAQQLGLTYNGYGRNGSCIAFDRTHDGQYNFGPAMYQRYTAMTPDADYVLIIAGHNDAEKVRDNADSLRMFTDSLHVMLRGIRQHCPNARIGFVTPWYVDRPGFEAVVGVIRQVCAQYGIPVLCNYDPQSVIDVRSEAFRQRYFQAPKDNAHLNAEGHDLFLPVGQSWFEREVMSR